MIDPKNSERDAGGKPLRTFPHPALDNAAVASAARQFAHLLDAEARLETIERIEITLSGRGPIERLFAVEAMLLAEWPKSRRRPSHDLVASTGELGSVVERPALTLRAINPDGAVVLRRVYDVTNAAPKARKRSGAAHG